MFVEVLLTLLIHSIFQSIGEGYMGLIMKLIFYLRSEKWIRKIMGFYLGGMITTGG